MSFITKEKDEAIDKVYSLLNKYGVDHKKLMRYFLSILDNQYQFYIDRDNMTNKYILAVVEENILHSYDNMIDLLNKIMDIPEIKNKINRKDKMLNLLKGLE